MAMGRPIVSIDLSDEERAYLERQVRRRKVDKGLADRCAMILGCAAGKNNGEVARAVGAARKPWASGGGAFLPPGLTVFSTSRAWRGHALSVTSRSLQPLSG